MINTRVSRNVDGPVDMRSTLTGNRGGALCVSAAGLIFKGDPVRQRGRAVGEAFHPNMRSEKWAWFEEAYGGVSRGEWQCYSSPPRTEANQANSGIAVGTLG